MHVSIIYEDRELLIIDKPSGLSVHQGPGGRDKTVVDWLIKHYPSIKNVGDPSASSGQETLRPGIVHRLDKETSGVMVVAKTQEAFERLKQLFKSRQIEKKYFALVCNLMPERNGEIRAPLARSKKFGTFTAQAKYQRGTLREAVTFWKLKKNFAHHALIEVIPKTGRTHQIRVHLASIGHPIAGDILYGGKRCAPSELKRLFLHASELSFSWKQGRLLFESIPPQELQNVLNSLKEI